MAAQEVTIIGTCPLPDPPYPETRMSPIRISLRLMLLPLILAMNCLGLTPGLSISQYAHDSWSRRDGMPANAVKALAQTQDGYVWLGTTAGLVRFDGASFTEISTDPEDQNGREPVTVLRATRDNGLWIGTRNNGLRFTKDGVMTSIVMGSADPSIVSMAIDNDALIFGTHTQLYRLVQGGTPEQLRTKRTYVAGLSLDRAGRLWVAEHGALELRRGESSETVVEDIKLVPNCVLTDSHGSTWMGTNEGLLRWKNGILTTYSKELGLLDGNVQVLYEDRHGNVWIGTREGLHRLRNGEPVTLGQWDRIALKSVTAILEDREGSLWVGTNDGLNRFKDVKLIPWTETEGVIANQTPSVNTTLDGSVYIFSAGDPHGISQLSQGTITRYETLVDGPSCVGRDGSLWVATTGQITQLKEGKVRTYGPEEGVPETWISAMVEEGDGLIICAINGRGVMRWKPGKREPLLLADGSPFTVPFHVQSAVRLRDGSIAMSTFDGLWLLKDGQVTRYTSAVGEESQRGWYEANPQSKTCHRTVVVAGMTEHWLTSAVQDKDKVIWLASQRGGLVRLSRDKATTFTTKEGLYSNQVYSVLTDDVDSLWMSSPRGIFRISMKEAAGVASGRGGKLVCDVFNSDDGMKTDEGMHLYQPTAAKAADGSLWFATKQGVVSVPSGRLARNTTPAHVLLEEVRVDGEVQRVGPGGIRVKAGREKVDFKFTALSLLVPERVRFKYKLEGYDADWIDGGRLREAHYTRIPPGGYRFRVVACNNDGLWNYDGAGVELEVMPRFHQTLWFGGLCVVGLAGLVVWGHRLRVRQLRRKERDLQERVDQRTAELSQTNEKLKREMVERIKAEQEVDRVHKQLLKASHQAGMAEIAAGVLHNIGNVLNSVNVSASVMMAGLRASKLPGLLKVTGLLEAKADQLPEFLGKDAKGKQVVPYLVELGRHLGQEQEKMMTELAGMEKNIDHIKDIVAMQQTYATVSGVVDTISPAELIEDALRMHARSLERHRINLIKDLEESMPPVEIEKHKVLQILVNLIQNAKQACDGAAKVDPTMKISLRQSRGMARISVEDNGVGIPAENLQRIFNHGFTTKKDGHGFGLHSSALAAKSFGGSLTVHSEGLGRGAVFVLEIPLKPL